MKTFRSRDASNLSRPEWVDVILQQSHFIRSSSPSALECIYNLRDKVARCNCTQSNLQHVVNQVASDHRVFWVLQPNLKNASGWKFRAIILRGFLGGYHSRDYYHRGILTFLWNFI